MKITIRYILLLGLALSLILALIPSVTAGAAVTTVGVSAPANVPLGGGFYATVSINGAVDLNGIQYDLLYNSNVIRMRGTPNFQGPHSGGLPGVSDGLVGGTVLPVDNWGFIPPGMDAGTIRVIDHMPGISGVNGDGYLAMIHFDVVGSGSSSLTLSNVIASDHLAAKSFPTIVAAPVTTVTTVDTIVTTDGATNITTGSATLNGTLKNISANATATLSFGYSMVHGGPYTNVPSTTASNPMPFSGNITGLSSNTTYYYEARSNVGSDTVTGAELTLTTSIANVPPTVNSLDPNTGAPGQSIANVIIRGTNLTGATAITFAQTGVSPPNAGGVTAVITSVSNSQISATINITSSAAVGPRDVTVSNSIGSSTLVNGFNVIPIGQTTQVSLQAPTIVPAGGGFYLTVKITGANSLKVFNFDLTFDPAVIQINGIESSHGDNSGVTPGVIHDTVSGQDVTFTPEGWTFQATPGTPSGDIRLLGDGSSNSGANGSGYLAIINFKVLGGVGSTSTLTLSGLALSDPFGNVTYPVTSSIMVTVGGAIVTTDDLQPGDIGMNNAILRGTLQSLVGDTSATLSFGYSTVHGGPYTNIDGNPSTATGSPTPFSANVTGLNANTAYFYVAQSQSDNPLSPVLGKVTGAEKQFTTLRGIAPVVTSIQPNKGQQGTILTGAAITGLNFTGANAVTFSNGGVADTNVTAAITNVTSTQITANVTINGSATEGARDVTVTTLQGGTSAPLLGGFIVESSSQPTINSIVPNTGKQGATLTGVTINGTHLAGGTVTFSINGVADTKVVTNITSTSSTQIIADVTIAADASPGTRDVTVTTLAGTATLPSGFSVTTAPTITSIIPNFGIQGTSIPVNINGTNLAGAGMNAVTFSTGGVTDTKVTANVTNVTNTQIKATVTIAPDASTISLRNVSVTVTAGTATLPNGFRVVSSAAPTITSITPNSGVQGTTVSATINGTHMTGASAVNFSGTGVTANQPTVVSDTQITATVTIAAGAATGTRDVTATNAAGEGAPLVNGFNVTPSGPGPGPGPSGGGGSLVHPTVSLVVPTDGATGVARSTTVKATFSTFMQVSTITSNTFTLTSGLTPVAGTVTFTDTEKTATFTPSAQLDYAKVYTATVTTGAQDLTGTGLGSNFTWSFTTESAPPVAAVPPTVISVSPLDKATGVGRDTTVKASFSSSMSGSTLNTSTFTLTAGSTSIAGTVTYSDTDKTATFTPSAQLAYGTTYTATITTGAHDFSGTGLASSYVWSFTTVTAPPATQTSTPTPTQSATPTQPTTPPTQSATPTQPTTPTPPPPPPSHFNWWIVWGILIGLGVIAIAAGTVIIVRRRRHSH